MFILLSSTVCGGLECPLNIILLCVIILMVFLCVGIYPGSCLIGKGTHKKILWCFPLSFCGSLWELYYYEKKDSEISSLKIVKEEEEDNVIDTEIHYNLRDRKPINMNEDLIF